jgi:hypothetical protein
MNCRLSEQRRKTAFVFHQKSSRIRRCQNAAPRRKFPWRRAA